MLSLSGIQLYVANLIVCAVLRKDRLVCEATKSVPPTTDARSSPSRSFQKVMRFSRFPSTDCFLGTAFRVDLVASFRDTTGTVDTYFEDFRLSASSVAAIASFVIA